MANVQDSQQFEMEQLKVTCISLATQLTTAQQKIKELEDEVDRLRKQIKKQTDNSGAMQRELFEACFQGNANLVQTLLMSQQVDVNAKYYPTRYGAVGGEAGWSNGETCLMFAALEGQLATVEMLVRDFKAEVNEQNDSGWTALHCAAKNGYLDVVRLLVEDGNASLDVKTKSSNRQLIVLFAGYTPVMLAAWSGEQAVVEYLLESGAKIDEKDRDGRTALHHAVMRTNAGDEMAVYLLEKGANVNERDNGEKTPLALATRDTVKELLVQHGGTL